MEMVLTTHSAFCPFSIGPRGCIGKSIAYAELMTALGRVVWELDFRLAPGTHAGERRAKKGMVGLGEEIKGEGYQNHPEYQLWDCFTSFKDGPMVEFKKRE